MFGMISGCLHTSLSVWLGSMDKNNKKALAVQLFASLPHSRCKPPPHQAIRLFCLYDASLISY
jgi:hypothetical protein